MASNAPPPLPLPSATMVALPPLTMTTTTTTATATTTTAPTTTTTSILDPESLLDALDAYSATSSSTLRRDDDDDSRLEQKQQQDDDDEQQQQQQRHRNTNNFDPIDFLNQHYHTEQQLTTALPALRSAITSRLTRLDETLSTTLRHQAALAPTLARDVVHARSAVLQLVTRIHQVQMQAQKSELAVLEITRDMKRLDHAKKHLQRTITALKRLHMLLHAAEQLRMAALVSPTQPIPQYKAAAHLVDATRLLLGHFEGYMESVPKMRQVRDAVGVIKGRLWEGIVKLFREVGTSSSSSSSSSPSSEEQTNDDPPSSMVQSTLADACLVIEALGPKSKDQFISDFIADHLQEYEQLYNPSPAAIPSSSATTTSSPGAMNKSFKKSLSDIGNDELNNSIRIGQQQQPSSSSSSSSSSSLDTVENRFTWYRTKLRFLQRQFVHVFPPNWNVHYYLTVKFLEMTARHLKFILRKYYNTNKAVRSISSSGVQGAGGSGGASGSGGGGGASSSSSVVSSVIAASSAASKFSTLSVSTHGGGGTADGKDNVSEGEKAVTSLLKALQKTILFEKEMSAWLSRDFGTKFMDPSKGIGGEGGGSGGNGKKENEEGDGDDDLEFDEHGRAVPAKSAEGIKIKYERRKKWMVGAESNSTTSAEGPVPPLSGIASTTFDDHMSPYVALEERSMDEQLTAAALDNTVDTRGEKPVFVSSTTLFIYMKNSINRCTALTKEKTFFLLQRAFQKKLRSYAGVLEKKLPPPVGQNVVAKLALSNIPGATGGAGGNLSSAQASNLVYRIPMGEEVTICHVIDTCEYCSDTVEALEDLIRDKIGDKYKESIDMSEEQGAFQDVTAKSIRVLVSGLEQRLDVALKEISRTNWASFDTVGEESSYVRTIHLTIHPFVVQVRNLIPSSYFRSFCDKFALAFASSYYRSLVGLKRISEAGTQQLLLDVYSIKTLMLRLPVLEAEKKPTAGGTSSRHPNTNLSGGSTIAPAMYTKMVNKEFRKLEVMLKLVGSPRDRLVEMFRAQWDCSIDTASMASDFTMITTLKGIARAENAIMLETLGVEVGEGGVGVESSTMTVNIQALQERGSDVAAKVNADLNQMRQRVDDFRKAFR